MALAVPAWLTILATTYIALAFLSAAWLAWDVAKRPQPMWIMNLVWPITALYLGPLAIWSYAKLARSGNGMRELPFWQQIVVEATHCGAGCSLGDIVAEFALYLGGVVLFGSALLTSYLGDFVLA